MSDEGQREERRFKQEHYDLLMTCAKKGDMTEWNEWYGKYKNVQKDAGKDDCGAWLEGAKLQGAHLEGAKLQGAHLEGANMTGANMKEANLFGANMKEVNLFGTKLEGADMSKANLEGADMIQCHLNHARLIDVNLKDASLYNAFLQNACLRGAHLEKTDMSKADLKDANLSNAHLKDAKLLESHLEGADMSKADLKDASLSNAHLKDAKLLESHLKGADLRGAHLEDAKLLESHLEGADLRGAHLEGASFYAAWLNEKTDLLGCTYDSKTDFTATSLTSAHIEPDTLTALQKNIRRKYWMKWYDQHVDMQDPVRLFWWLSDYGTSSTRCIGAFALLILAACVIYFFITGAAIADIPQLFADTILATFGFGSLFDQLTGPLRLLLAAHVLFGYFLLAVLITRFAVMFQSLTP